MKKLFWFSIGTLLTLFVGTFLYVSYQFHKDIAVHVQPSSQTPGQFSLTVKPYLIQSTDGLKIAAWYIPVDNAKAVLILIHGYANTTGGKNALLGQAKFLHDGGYSTVLLDLRSFGESEGEKIALGTKEWQEVAAVYDFAKSLPENGQIKVGFLGESMGAAIAIITAGKLNKGDFIIAQVPFSDYQTLWREQLTKKGYPKYSMPILLPFLNLAAILDLGADYQSYSPDKLISKIAAPILIISAQNDDWVGSQAGKKLFDLANSPKEFWQAESSHEVFKDQPDELKTKVLEFLDKYTL